MCNKVFDLYARIKVRHSSKNDRGNCGGRHGDQGNDFPAAPAILLS